MTSFEVTVLGASGGPDGGATQCFMIRPQGFRGAQSVCVDGGAGANQLSHMIAQYGSYANGNTVESFYLNDVEPSSKYFDKRATVDFGLPKYLRSHLESEVSSRNTRMKALEVYNGIKEYYITHVHLDHVAELVLNSPLAYEADDNSIASKKIFGLDFTVNGFKDHIFNDLVWPNLVSNMERLQLMKLENETIHSCQVFPQWDVIPLQVHHGFGAYLTSKRVYSTLYLFRDKKTKDCILICGDLEADFCLGPSESLLQKVLEYLVENVDQGKLRGIAIECSSTMSVDENQLYGHLSPIHLVDTLDHLRNLYGKKNALKGLQVMITHVKRICASEDPRLTILDEVRELASQKGLHDVMFSMAIHGFTFGF